MTKMTTLLLLLASIGCGNNHSKSTKTVDLVPTSSSIKESATDLLEVLDMDSIVINEKFRFQTSRSKLREHLGKSDSTIKANYDCGGYFDVGDVSVDYYGSSSFETSMEKTVVRNINFQDGRFTVKAGNIIFNKNTTLTAIKDAFPASAKKSYLWKDVSDNKEYTVVRLLPKLNYDDQWVLKFYNGKLIDMEYWIPC